MDALTSFRPVVPPTRQALAPASFSPPGEGVLLVPNGDGYDATRKIPCADVDRVLHATDAKGAEVQYVPGKGDVACLDAAGNTRWRVALPAGHKVGSFHADPSRNRILVKTGTALLALDADSGKMVASKSFGQVNYLRQVVVRDNGDIAVSDEDTLKTLDGDLAEKAPGRSVGMRPEKMAEMPDGSLLLMQDACPAHVLVLGPDGQPRFEQHNVGLHSVVTDARGNLWMVDDKSLGHVVEHKQKDVLRYDVAAGRADRFPATSDTESVVPRSDGSYIVYDDKLSKPSVILCAADGAQGPRFTFPREGHLRQFHLSTDERTAWAVLDHYSDKDASQRTLYRMDLAPSSGLGRLFKGRTAETVYTSTAPDAGFSPAVLSDGRIAIFKKDAVEMLDAGGHVTTTYASPQQMLADNPGAEVVSRSHKLGVTGDPDLPGSLVGIVERLSGQGSSVAQDGCLDFPMAPVSQAVEDPAVLQQLALEGSTLSFAFRDAVELPFPDGGTAKMETGRAGVTTASETATFTVSEPERYTAALPVRVGDRPYLAAGTSAGRLHWYDVAASTDTTFAVGAPVQRIDIDRGAIRAIATDGRVFVYRPLDVPRAAEVVGKAEARTGEVVVEEKQVVIGGVAIPRRG